MLKTIDENEISSCIKDIKKKTSYSGHPKPLNDLSDRDFEILLYLIFQKKISIGTFSEKYDKIYLMQGVGEKGFDSMLTQNGKKVGLIQCKKYSKNINKNVFFEEILKFVMNCLNDNTILSDLDIFDYHFATSTGLSQTTISLISNFKKAYLLENLENTFNKLKAKYSYLSSLNFNDEKENIDKIIAKIEIHVINPSDILLDLNTYNDINQLFFSVTTVTDNALLDNIVEKYLKPMSKKIIIEKPEITEGKIISSLKAYLSFAYAKYSTTQTLVFGNSQKKLEEFYYPLTIRCKIDPLESKYEEYSTETFNEKMVSKYNKILIKDNGGMGKSTILKWIFTSIIKENKGVPIFIELRKLYKGHSIIEEIQSQLSELDKELDIDVVKNVLAQKDFIFFFDGFDEISDDNKVFVTKDLEQFMAKSPKRTFFLTSRPEDALVCFNKFKEFDIRPLEIDESFEIINKLGNYNERSKKLISAIEAQKMSNIKDFLKSPLLISLLYKKFEYRESIPFKKVEFYYEVFDALFHAHDIIKGDSFIRDKYSGLSKDEFHSILRGFAYYTKRREEVEYTKSKMITYLDTVKILYPNLNFESDKFIDDLVLKVPLFQKEGLNFRWAHKSIQEYFTAEFICRDGKEKTKHILKSLYFSENSLKYSNVFEIYYEIDYKMFRDIILYPICTEFIKFCETTFLDIDKNSIDDSDIKIRQGIIFNQTIYICKAKKNTPKSIPEEIKHYIAEKNFRSVYFLFNYFILINFTGFNLRDFLNSSKNPLVKVIKDVENDNPITEIECDLMQLNDLNLTNPLNSPNCFSRVNEVVDFVYFDYNEAKKIIVDVENNEALDNATDFFGL